MDKFAYQKSFLIARAAPSAKVYSVELSAANAEIARSIWAHAGVGDRITCVVDTICDGGDTLHPRSVVVADNVKLPGAPDYRNYMRQNEGRTWSTTEYKTHAEYQTLLPDLVLESPLLR